MRAQSALILAFAATLAHAGDIYTWKDKEGRVHYSDTPPAAGVPVRTVGAKPAAPAAADGEQAQAVDPAKAAEGAAQDAQKADPKKPKTLADQEVEFRKRRAAEQEALAKADKAKAEADERKRNCEQARNTLAALESGQRVSRHNAQGEREYLEDDARAAESERARKAVASWCK